MHHTKQMTPTEGSKNLNGKMGFSNLQNIKNHKPKIKLGDLYRNSDFRSVFIKGDNTNYCKEITTIKEVIYDTIPNYKKNNSPDRYNENLLRPTKLTLDQNNQVMKKLFSTQES